MRLSCTFRGGGALAAVLVALLTGCGDTTGRELAGNATVESCMQCHNGARHTNYEGPGLENPHPFPGADSLACTACHGGNGNGVDRLTSHVPPPPEIGDDENLEDDRNAYFNRLTLAGIDKFDDYQVNGQDYTAIDYLQFINPGDLRVVTQGRSCGACHSGHVDCVAASPLATEAGVLSGARYAIGADNALGNTDHENTAAEYGVRDVTDPAPDLTQVGAVDRLLEYPVYSVRGDESPDAIDRNPIYDADQLDDDIDPVTNRVVTGSPLANLVHEQIAFTCGDCHLGSAGANNRAGDFRSSGCTSCHMPYSLGGRTGSQDPNVNRLEPADPDQIRAPERAHVRSHRIASVFKTLPGGQTVQGIDDYACAGCHQGSNRTVMQYWGIRLDQNEDLHRDVQYPAMPASFDDTRGDPRLFDPVVNNRTFNGRDRRQYILREDYDGDTRDDTPADVHYEAGMGCIDCHGSYDLHGGDVTAPNGQQIMSRMEQVVAIQCEDCHGGSEAYANVVQGTAHDGQTRDIATDSKGNPLAHVVREADGHYYMTSRLTGRRHYVPQTLDTVVDNQRVNPFTQQPIYSAKASFAMGRDDGLATTGLGPQQAGDPTGFRHGDSMDCASCHASWTNTCMGCHLEGEYDRNNNFSNITGENIVFEERNADFVYQSPVFFQLGVNSRNKITQVSANTKMFFTWRDRNNEFSRVFAFSDRNGGGADPAHAYPSLSHNAIMAHSIRGKVTGTQEGPRYCVACHLTSEGLTQYGALYDTFRTNMANNAFDQLNFTDLTNHFGLNTGNDINSPLWVHMVAGLGTGLFLFDENGCPVNPIDEDDNRAGCQNDGTDQGDRSPADRFNLATVLTDARYNLDKIVDPFGVATGSNNHPLLQPNVPPFLRETAANQNMAGPLGLRLIDRLTNPDPTIGIVLDSYLDADGDPIGGAIPLLNPPPAPQTSGQNSK